MEEIIRKTKARLLQMHFEAGVGHIGGNLSALDMILYLHHRELKPEDVFLLSKGHAAGALYAALWSLGRLTDADLSQFHKEGTHLSGHPAPGWRSDIPFATGSLGHGLSLACGLALGKRLKKENGRVFCLLSDGEWNEGSTWEGLIFAAHQELGITALIDLNGLQGFGTTAEVADLSPLEDKLRPFGVDVSVVDGHDWLALGAELARPVKGPRVIVARTVKGHGVSFMENKMEWHYLPMTESQYRQALAEIESASAKGTKTA
jgi:transketolase